MGLMTRMFTLNRRRASAVATGISSRPFSSVMADGEAYVLGGAKIRPQAAGPPFNPARCRCSRWPAAVRAVRAAGKPGLNRYLRTTPAGKLRIDTAKIKTEENLHRKYLLRCPDPRLPAEDIAVGYKQLPEVERGWRDMKQVIDLRPVYHRLEERIRAHVLLCWLALLLIRITETTAGTTWQHARRELDRLHVGTFTGPAGTFQQVTTPSTAQKDLLAKLSIPLAKQIIDLQPAAR